MDKPTKTIKEQDIDRLTALKARMSENRKTDRVFIDNVIRLISHPHMTDHDIRKITNTTVKLLS